MHFKLAILPGDGIGPEVTVEAVACLRAVAERFDLDLELEEAIIGGRAIDEVGIPLPEPTLRLAERADAVLLGAVGGPKWDDPKSTVRPEQALLGIRQALGLFANLRPVKAVEALLATSTLKPEVVRGIDILVIRELTGGIYFGKPSERRQGKDGREAVDTLVYSEQEVQRVVEVAFDLARGRKKKVTSVDKANVLSSSRLWREVAHEVAARNKDVAYEDVLVDAMAMHLIRRPRDFDVIVTENMFGDILTDEAAMLPGSMGLLPSASLGARRKQIGAATAIFGLYEPIHGSAPDIAGKGIANPLAAILSAALLLRFSLAQEAAAAALEDAVDRVLAKGLRTTDLALPGEKTLSTQAMSAAVQAEIAAGSPGSRR